MEEATARSVGILAREELAAGFALAGAEPLTAGSGAEALELLRKAMKDGRFGMIIVDESLLGDVGEAERRELAEQTVPLIVTVPGEMRWRDVEESTDEDFVARLIRRAVGYQLNIQV